MYPSLKDSDSEEEQGTVVLPAKLPRGILFGIIVLLTLNLLVSSSGLVLTAYVEHQEVAVEHQVHKMAVAQESNAHRTSALLVKIAKRTGNLQNQEVAAEVAELCDTQRCGLSCTHAKASGFGTFVSGLASKIPAVLSMIPGIGSQLSQLASLAMGVKDTIQESNRFAANGPDCAADITRILMDNQRGRQSRAHAKALWKMGGDTRMPLLPIANRRKRSLDNLVEAGISDDDSAPTLREQMEEIVGSEDEVDDDLALALLTSKVFEAFMIG